MLKEIYIKNKLFYKLFCIFFFVFYPFYSILFQCFVLFYLNSKDRDLILLLNIFLSLFLGLINATKLPETDLINYYNWFELAGNSSLKEFIIIGGKEPGFFILTYILNIILFGNKTLYIIIVTFIMYYPFLHIIYKFYLLQKTNNYIIILGIVFIAFFPQLFSVSGNIIRQVLASSLIFYFIINRLFFNKNYWLIFIFSIFTHISVIFFIPFIFIDKILTNFNFKNLIFKIIPLLITFLSVYKIISEYFLNYINSPILSYAFMRLTKDSFDVYDKPELIVTILILMIFFIFIFKIFYLEETNITYLIKYKHLGTLYFVFVIIYFFTYNKTEISHSLIYFPYFFLPFVFPILLFKKNSLNTYILSGTLMVLMIIYFIVKLDSSIWTFAPTKNIIGDLIIHIFYK